MEPTSPLNTNPSAPQSTPVEPISPTPPEQPPKKSRKKLIIISSIIAAVVLAIAATIVVIMQTAAADEASKDYKADVVAHVEAIRKGPEMKDRLDIIDDKVVLKNVWLGLLVSDTYRQASELQTRYDTLLDETKPFFQEAFMLFDIITVIRELGALVVAPVEGTYDDSEVYATNIEKRATEYDALANKLAAYYFDEDYRDAKDQAVENIRTMSGLYKEMAAIVREEGENGQSAINILDEKHAEAYSEVRSFIQNEVIEYTEALTKELPNEVGGIDDQYEAFLNSLK